MLYIMIKNNLKLIFRNKMILCMMVVGPILVIAALSSAFHGMLNNGYEEDEFSVGCYIEEDSPVKGYENTLMKVFEEQEIHVQKYTQNFMENAVTDGEVDVFIYCTKDKCEVGSRDSESMAAKTIAYSMEQFAREYHLAFTEGMREAMGESPTERVSLKRGSLPYTKMADAEDYYGIIEIIYFLSFGAIFLTAVVQSERKNRIQQRFVISPTSGLTIYLGKFIPCELMMVCSLTVSALIATVLFDIHWGNNPGTLGILLLMSVTMTAFGILLLYMVNNLAVSVIALFGITWVAGFLGGSFETYMFSSLPENIKRMSPLYYINRTVVEYSTMGHSDYTEGCVLYMLGILTVCAVLGILLMNRRMEEKA